MHNLWLKTVFRLIPMGRGKSWAHSFYTRYWKECWISKEKHLIMHKRVPSSFPNPLHPAHSGLLKPLTSTLAHTQHANIFTHTYAHTHTHTNAISPTPRHAQSHTSLPITAKKWDSVRINTISMIFIFLLTKLLTRTVHSQWASFAFMRITGCHFAFNANHKKASHTHTHANTHMLQRVIKTLMYFTSLLDNQSSYTT